MLTTKEIKFINTLKATIEGIENGSITITDSKINDRTKFYKQKNVPMTKGKKVLYYTMEVYQ